MPPPFDEREFFDFQLLESFLKVNGLRKKTHVQSMRERREENTWKISSNREGSVESRVVEECRWKNEEKEARAREDVAASSQFPERSERALVFLLDLETDLSGSFLLPCHFPFSSDAFHLGARGRGASRGLLGAR